MLARNGDNGPSVTIARANRTARVPVARPRSLQACPSGLGIPRASNSLMMLRAPSTQASASARALCSPNPWRPAPAMTSRWISSKKASRSRMDGSCAACLPASTAHAAILSVISLVMGTKIGATDVDSNTAASQPPHRPIGRIACCRSTRIVHATHAARGRPAEFTVAEQTGDIARVAARRPDRSATAGRAAHPLPRPSPPDRGRAQSRCDERSRFRAPV